MRSRRTVVSLGVVLVLAGCGGTNRGSSTPATSSSLAQGASQNGTTAPGAPVTYSVKLHAKGTPAGAPNGSGLAVISITEPSGTLCWRFSQLKNVGAPTMARVFRGFPGNPGFSLGRAYKSSGCVGEPRLLLALLATRPRTWYVGISSARFPASAVRGEL
jgi:hypothetical protein